MAHILNATSPVVNVDYPVGGSAPNRRDDVMLVQGLLLTWAWNLELSDCRPNPVKDIDLNAFRVDGNFGDRTKALLRLYVSRIRASGGSAEGWIMPLHIEVLRSQGKPFKAWTGSRAINVLVEVPMLVPKGAVDTARGTYQRYGLFCLGWDMPPTLAASLSHRRSKPHFTPTGLIDI